MSIFELHYQRDPQVWTIFDQDGDVIGEYSTALDAYQAFGDCVFYYQPSDRDDS